MWMGPPAFTPAWNVSAAVTGVCRLQLGSSLTQTQFSALQARCYDTCLRCRLWLGNTFPSVSGQASSRTSFSHRWVCKRGGSQRYSKMNHHLSVASMSVHDSCLIGAVHRDETVRWLTPQQLLSNYYHYYYFNVLKHVLSSSRCILMTHMIWCSLPVFTNVTSWRRIHSMERNQSLIF